MSIRFVDVLLAVCCLALWGCQSAPKVPDGAVQAQTGAPQAEVDRKSVALFDQALDAIHAERYAEAEKLLKELTTRDPNLSGPWVNLGSVYEALGDEYSSDRGIQKSCRSEPGQLCGVHRTRCTRASCRRFFER